LRWPKIYPIERLFLVFSAAFLLLYGVLFTSTPGFWMAYPIDGVIFGALLVLAVTLTGYGLVRPEAFNRTLEAWLAKTTTVWVSVILVWLWLLAFAYYDPHHTFVGELIWLPLLVWAAAVGTYLLWRATPSAISAPAKPFRSHRTALAWALVFVVLCIVRDFVFYDTFSPVVRNDTISYLEGARDFIGYNDALELPKRIFPYVFMNFITGSWIDPNPLLITQIVIGALTTGFMVYVLSRKSLWLGIGVGMVFVANLTWSNYNLAILTESMFVSFNVLCLAVMLFHMQRRNAVRSWEFVMFGVLCAWTFLFRGTGLPLIVPVMLIYALMYRRWRQPLLILGGFSAFLLMVGTYNQLRFNQFGLIGPQHDTIVSALFSYHLFSPENGEVSQRLDTQLRNCMGYIDYDDVPLNNVFIYHRFNPCTEVFGNRQERTRLNNQAFLELVRARPFEFARVVVYEIAVGAASNDHLFRYAQCDRDPAQCRPNTFSAATMERVSAFNTVVSTPIMHTIGNIGSPTIIVLFSAFLMMFGALMVASREKFLVLVCIGFIIYQLTSIAIVHTFIPRYGVILTPFQAILAVLLVFAAARGLWYVRRYALTRTGIAVWALVAVYVLANNPTLVGRVTAPAMSAVNVNLFGKQGVTLGHFELYRLARETGIRPLFADSLSSPLSPIQQRLNVVRYPHQLSAEHIEQFIAWQNSYQPGYLHQAAIDHVVITATHWDTLSDGHRALLLDPQLYRLMGTWEADDDTLRLFEVIGDGRAVQPVYQSETVAVFLQPDGKYHVYRLDADQNGTFIARIDIMAVFQGELNFVNEDGWRIYFEPRGTNHYRMIVANPEDEIVDRGTLFRRP
jgi:hypothetical protein